MSADLINCLTQVAQRWLNREDILRREAVAAAQEFCLSTASFHWALDSIFSQWTVARISEMVKQNPFKTVQFAAQILAGNTPAIIAQGFLQAAILHVPQVIKVPRAQPTFARLLQQSLVENNYYAAKLFTVDTWQDRLPQFYTQLAEAELVLAYGADETITMLKQYLAPTAIYCGHGHAESAAIIFKEATESGTLEQLAYDMLSYDQRGCLSPRVVFIEHGGMLSPAECARILAEDILPLVARQLPRGGLFPGEAAEILHQRIACRFRGPVYCGEDWTVSYADNHTWSSVTLPRFMFIKSFSTSQVLVDTLIPIKNNLMSLGIAGPSEKIAAFSQALAVSCCALGEMQKKILLW